MPYKPIIFVSYAHADEPEKPAEGEVKWLSFVTSFLRPVVKQGAVEFWIDSLMRGGADWEREIERRLRACDIFVLLVSRYSLSSDYVVKKEIPIIRERQASGEDIHFYPLLLTPTPGKALDVVRAWNLRLYEGKPLSHYPTNERSALMSDAADEIAEIAEEIAARKRMTPPASSSPPELEGATIAHDNAFENSFRGQSSELVSAIAAREAPVLNDHLERRAYIVGDTYTIADISAWGWLDRASRIFMGRHHTLCEVSRPERRDNALRQSKPANPCSLVGRL